MRGHIKWSRGPDLAHGPWVWDPCCTLYIINKPLFTATAKCKTLFRTFLLQPLENEDTISYTTIKVRYIMICTWWYIICLSVLFIYISLIIITDAWSLFIYLLWASHGNVHLQDCFCPLYSHVTFHTWWFLHSQTVVEQKYTVAGLVSVPQDCP